MPVVTITDFTFPTLEIEEHILHPLGYTVRSGQWKTPEALVPQVADADAIITQYAPVNATVIAGMAKAKVIIRYGIGVDSVDLDAAKDRGIPVCNVPDYWIDEVADHTLGFLLAITRQVLPNNRHIGEGKRGLAASIDQMMTLRNLTIGIVGFGRIGRAVATRLKAFKCQIVVHDPFVSPTEIERADCLHVALSEVFSRADVITLHCPSTAQTRGMISNESLALMKSGVILINTARGDIVDSHALTEALQSGRVSAAGLDVFAPEPIPVDHPIRKMNNVLLSSHLASCSVSAMRKLRETVANLAVLAIRGEPLPSVVNGVRSS